MNKVITKGKNIEVVLKTAFKNQEKGDKMNEIKNNKLYDISKMYDDDEVLGTITTTTKKQDKDIVSGKKLKWLLKTEKSNIANLDIYENEICIVWL